MNRITLLINKLLQNTQRDFLVALGIIFIVLMMIVPMPTVLLDLFMSLNLLFSIVIILNVLYIRTALEFSVFPSILLISTVFSLALNISSTRLILTQGELFSGTIIRAFGSFVVGTGGSEGVVVGIIIFLIIVAVQFIVITKGASRVAEVSARFTLDAMPGKQMAIEAEFNSGTITEQELIKKRRELQQEVDFYGSMDGASKFVSGNIKAGIFITFINIIGGMVVGVLLRGEDVSSALTNYVQLTIGDGLVSQLPALLISTASGIIVTRAVSQGNIGQEVSREFANYTKIYYIAGGLLCFLAILPGFPWYLLFPLGIILCVSAVVADRRKAVVEKQKVEKEQQISSTSQAETPKLEPLDTIALEIGYDLVPLVQDENGKAELLNRISSIRREIGVKLGIIVPLIRIVDNYMLQSSSYSVKLNGVEIGKGLVKIDRLLAIHSSKSDIHDATFESEKTVDPAFGLPAFWISSADRAKAERDGFTVADPTSVLSTHIAQLLEKHASELLSREDVAAMLEQYKEVHPTTVEELKKHLQVSHVQHVFRRLLDEQVSLRNLTALFETLGDYGAVTKDIDFLVEKSRQSLSRQITGQYIDEHNTLYAYTLHPRIEKTFADAYTQNSENGLKMIPPQIREQLIQSIANTIVPVEIISKNQSGEDTIIQKSTVLVTSEMARPFLYKLLHNSINKHHYTVPILSFLDISDNCKLENAGVIMLPQSETEATPHE